MEYGILVAVGEDGGFQIIDEVDSPAEARVMARGYMKDGPENDCLAPDHFEIHRRGTWGHYTRVEQIEVAA